MRVSANDNPLEHGLAGDAGHHLSVGPLGDNAVIKDFIPDFGSVSGDVVDLSFLLDRALLVLPEPVAVSDAFSASAAENALTIENGSAHTVVQATPLPMVFNETGLTILYDDSLIADPSNHVP